MTAPIIAEALTAAWLRDKLLEQFPELADDDQALADTLEGLTDFNEMCRRILDSALNDKAMAAALKSRIEEMAERASRLEVREQSKRATVALAMDYASIRKMEFPEFTVSLRNRAAEVIITDEAKIPTEFWKEKIVRTLDKSLLKEAIETDTVPGAELSNGGHTLSVRCR